MKALELIQGSDEWHAWRRSIEGGSDAPAVLGICPYRTPREVYLEKVSEPSALDDDGGNEFIFAKGHKTEGLIRKEFAELTGVEMKPMCVMHDTIFYMGASLDGFDPRLGVLEAKLVGQDVLAAAREGIIPHNHMAQVQHQLAVTGADIGQWFGHDGKANGALVEVRLDKNYVAGLMDVEARFWECVVNRMPPPLSSRDYLIPEDVAMLEELREAKVQAENADAYLEQLKAKAAAHYGHPKVAGAGVKFYLVTKTGSVSWADIPEVAAAEAEIEAVKARLEKAYIEKFRKKPSQAWTLKMDKVKAVKS